MYVLNPFTDNAIFDYELFSKDVKDIVVYANEILDEGLPLHPLKEQKDSVKDWRQIGFGIMGLADLFIKMGIHYGSPESVQLSEKISSIMINEAIISSANLAKEFGTYPMYNKQAVLSSPFFRQNISEKVKVLVEQYGLRNSQLLTCAPTGTISTMFGISGGIEPIFENSYTRKTESLHGKDEYYKVYTPIVQEYMKNNNIEKEEDLPDFFVTTRTLNYKNRIDMQSIWQKHIDASISSTINVPETFTIEQVVDLYMYAWEKGLKGITMYRDKCERTGILTTDNKKEEANTIEDFPRGYIEDVPEGLTYRKFKLTTGCGSLYFFLGIDEFDGKIYDCFCNTDGTSGCPVNSQAVSRLLSASLRGGIPVEYLAKQLDKAGICPSFQYKRGKGEKLSPGKSCSSAIANVIKNVLKEFTDIENKQEIKNEVQEYNQMFSECPECHQKTLVKESSCDSCKNCGFSKCS
jgi:ribonucleoside-diphosphate reductase alpha chain